MLATVLNSSIAIQASVRVVRAFIHLREMLGAHRELVARLEELEHRLDGHDSHIRTLFEAIRELMQPTARPAKRIGFRVQERRGRYRA